MIRAFVIMILIASPAAAQIRIGGIGVGGYSAGQWGEMIEKANEVIAGVEGPRLINAGFVAGRSVPADLESLHAYAAQAGIRADVVFVAAGRGPSAWIARNVCWQPDAIGCASPQTRSGMLLYLPRAGQIKTFLHELGHVIGLDHSNNRQDLMFSHEQPGPRISRGYLRRLWALARRRD